MRAEEIREHLRTRPFVPIRVFLSDGSAYEVRHPDMAMVTQRLLIIGIQPRRDGIPMRSVHCDPLHVTRIEPLAADAA